MSHRNPRAVEGALTCIFMGMLAFASSGDSFSLTYDLEGVTGVMNRLDVSLPPHFDVQIFCLISLGPRYHPKKCI